MLKQKMIAICSALVFLTSMFATTNVAYAANGKISMNLLKAAFIIGGTGGKGTLIFGGKT